jgi:hypothetical protein
MFENPLWSIIQDALVKDRYNLLVYGVGICLSVLHRRRNPKMFLVTLIAFAVFLVHSFGLRLALSLVFDEQSDPLAWGTRIHWIDSISTPIWICAWVILMTAIFNPRINPNAGDNRVAQKK